MIEKKINLSVSSVKAGVDSLFGTGLYREDTIQHLRESLTSALCDDPTGNGLYLACQLAEVLLGCIAIASDGKEYSGENAAEVLDAGRVAAGPRIRRR